jgi:hypothetical protein
VNAHLIFRGGGMFLPANTPYERELLIECVESTSKRYGQLRLEIDGRRWSIHRAMTPLPVCEACSRWPQDLDYPGGGSGALAVFSSLAKACRRPGCEVARRGAGDAAAPAAREPTC